MLKDMKQVKILVRRALEDYPRTRDSYPQLFAIIYQYLGVHHKVSYVELMKLIDKDELPSLESIRRSRQKIQEGGEFPGKNRKKRIKHSKEIRKKIVNF